MPAFLLRFAGTNSLAGFYAADNENDLFDLIDEETDPSDYEYAIIKRGYGIEFRDRNIAIGSMKKVDKVLAKAGSVYLTSEVLLALIGDGCLEWRRLYQK